jgi:hypothetical protein
MCSDCAYEDALELAEEMLDDPRYEFADRSVEGIRDTIKRNKHVTERQHQALMNIKNSVPDKDNL